MTDNEVLQHKKRRTAEDELCNTIKIWCCCSSCLLLAIYIIVMTIVIMIHRNEQYSNDLPSDNGSQNSMR